MWRLRMSKDLNMPRNTDTESGVKPYHEPHLVAYGDVREITKNMGGTTGQNDGGAGKDKTSP